MGPWALPETWKRRVPGQDPLSSALVIFFFFSEQGAQQACLFLPTQLEDTRFRVHLLLVTLIVNPLFIDSTQNSLCLVLN